MAVDCFSLSPQYKSHEFLNQNPTDNQSLALLVCGCRRSRGRLAAVRDEDEQA